MVGDLPSGGIGNCLGETLYAVAWAHKQRGDYEDALARVHGGDPDGLEGIDEELRLTTEALPQMLRIELGQGVQPNSYEAPAANPQPDLREAKWEARQLLSAGDNDGAIAAAEARAPPAATPDFFWGRRMKSLRAEWSP